MAKMMRVLLIGLLCALCAAAVGTIAEFFTFGLGVSAAGMQAVGIYLLFAVLGLWASLLIGLCVVGPLLPHVERTGLRSWPGFVLVLGMLIVQLIASGPILDAEFGGYGWAALASGIAATVAALAFFDRIAAWKRGARTMAVILAGFSCGAIAGPALTALVGLWLFNLSPRLLGVFEVDRGSFVLLDALAVAASLLGGLCVAGPVSHSIVGEGLRTRRGALLIVGILIGQFAILIALVLRLLGGTYPHVAADMSGMDTLMLCGATALPGLAATLLALTLFELLLMGSRRREGPGSPA